MTSLPRVVSVSLAALLAALLALGGMMGAPAAAAPVVEGGFAPRDECAALPGAAAFRASLAHAVAHRDADAFVALADPQVRLDFGDGAGRAELARRLTGAGGAELWRELAAMLPLGCAVDQGNLVLPWFFAQELGGDDPYNLLLVTGEKVPLLPKADAEARPLRLLSWALVEPEEGFDESSEFQPVRIAGGGPVGFVAAARLRSPLGYRLIAGRSGDGWAIEAFLAGD